jgi:sulfide:quinone oxidoreductase
MAPAARFKVVIAGGGVAALEAALALHELGTERISTTLLTPRTTFTHRPLSVLEPFPAVGGRRYDVARIAQDAGAQVVEDRLANVDGGRRRAHTARGRELAYDALLIAYGAEVRPRFRHAHTIDDQYLGQSLRSLVQDVEDGYVRRVAFVAAGSPAWPLPLYELALMTSQAAYDLSAEVSVFVITAERAPLEVFGARASRAAAAVLARHHVECLTSPACDVPSPGRVVLAPDRPPIHVQSVVAMPELSARQVPGVPTTADGFIAVDANCRVGDLDGVYAAGDATAFPVKHGSIASRQADTAAAEMARRAGADVPSEPFEAALHGIMLGDDRPLYMSARLTPGGEPTESHVSRDPLWHPAGKIAARRLGPYLHHADQLTGHFSHAAL